MPTTVLELPTVQSSATQFATFQLGVTSYGRERQEVHNPDYQNPLDYHFYNQHEATPTSNFTHNHHIHHVTSIDKGTDDMNNQYRAADNDQVLNSLTVHRRDLADSQRANKQNTVLTTDATPDTDDRTHDALQGDEPTLPSRSDQNIDHVVNEQDASCYAVLSEQRARLT